MRAAASRGALVLLTAGASACAPADSPRGPTELAQAPATPSTASPAPGCTIVTFGTESPDTADCRPTQSAGPSPAEDAPPPIADWEVAAAFLSAEQAGQAEQPGWSVQPDDPEAGPLLDPCNAGEFPRAELVVASDERVLASTRDPGGSGFAQEVFRYASASAAAGAFEDYLAGVARCPSRTGPDGFVTEYAVVERAGEAGAQRALVRLQPCTPEGQCTSYFGYYALLAQSGDGVTVAEYAQGEDGDPADAASRLLTATATALDDAVRG